MKTTKSLSLSAITIIFLFAILLSATVSSKPDLENIKEKTFARYISDLQEMLKAAEVLHKKSNQFESKEQIKELKEALQETRHYWKKAEFLAEYLNAEFVKDYINGPPLLHLERNAGSPVIQEPKGFQVLEELIFSQDPLEEKKSIIELSENLRDQSMTLLKNQMYIKLSHRQIFEACRAELVRIFALGLTGFDTPGSGNSILDSKTALLTLYNTVDPYLIWVKDTDQNLAKKVDKEFTAALNYLNRNQDFDSFDRLYYLKTYINPLYSDLLKIHEILEIETRFEVENFRNPVNYNSENIFSIDFLDKYYFTSLNEKADTPEIIELGKLLFFDPALSSNNKRACASCHVPEKAFTDGLKKSLAFDFNGTVERNSPTLINSVFAEKYFYDLRALRLQDQVEHVMVNEKEFHFNFNEVSLKLMSSNEYVSRFSAAFSNYRWNNISRETISLALTAYVQSLIALNSPFDKYVRGEINEIDPAVKRGFNLFMGKAACGTCHFAPTFSGLVPPFYKENETEVLGIPVNKDTIHAVLDSDLGRAVNKRLLEMSPIFNHSFKTPTLRNVELTAPYMHNGVFDTLEEVMEFYNRGGGTGLGLEVPNQTLSGDKLNLNKGEMNDIISFMKALTDTSGLSSRPVALPVFPDSTGLDLRIVGGEY